MGIKEKQTLYDMLFTKRLNDIQIPRGSNKNYAAYLYGCHLYALLAGNLILEPLGETLDGIQTIVDA